MAGLEPTHEAAAHHNGAVRLTPFVVAAALVVGGAACGRTAGTSPREPAGAATVTRVVDGDTIRVRLQGAEETVRLLGIDTPETHRPGTPVECFGAEATVRMTALLPKGTPVRLVRDVEARDRYGRLLAYVYRASDGMFVNLVMAREGYASTLTYPPNVAHADAFVAAVRTARQSQRGLWRSCGNVHIPLAGPARAPPKG